MADDKKEAAADAAKPSELDEESKIIDEISIDIAKQVSEDG